MGPGEPHVFHAPFTDVPALGIRRSLAYFLQFSDLHITDEESPVRLEGVTRIAFASAYRPQDHLTTQLNDALIQTVNQFSFPDRSFDFAFVSGDIADNSQENEVMWVKALLEGGVVEPDSGVIDDPVPGPGNDFTDPFQAAGLDTRSPWYMLFGNHDQMYLGSFNPTERVRETATGDRILDLWNLGAFSDGQVTFGARDASKPFAPVVRAGTRVPPDARRRMLDPQEFMAMFQGRGFTAEAIARRQTSYAVRPIAGFPLTMIAVDTVMEMIVNERGEVVQPAGSEGEISRALWDGFIVPELDAADRRGYFILFISHHCTESLQPGVTQVQKEEVRKKLKSYARMLAHLCGHGHRTQAWFWQKGSGDKRGYPELIHASSVDFPIQARVIELVDNGNATLSLFTTQIEPNVAPGSLAYEALMYAAAAYNFPPISLLPRRRYEEDRDCRNMEIVLPYPEGIDVAALPTRGPVESQGRLWGDLPARASTYPAHTGCANLQVLP